MLKDWKLLRRDPVQWSQFLIFFGLIVLYFLNVDRFNNPQRDISYFAWINMVSFLNLAVVGLILSTFTTRFIYPMISLEGHCFWILGLFPMRARHRALEQVCVRLARLLGAMRVVDPAQRRDAARADADRRGTPTGVRAVVPGAVVDRRRPRRDDARISERSSPSKISAGFGGTLNLVLSALYIIVVVVLTALPCHFYLITGNAPWRESFLNPTFLQFWLWGGSVTALVVGIAATILPLWCGLRSFRQLEFQ